MTDAIITLLTDFGTGEYVAQMKGIIHSIAPSSTVIDIAHDICPQNVFEGAFVLMNTVTHFPVGVHVAVVDPGVGGARAPMVIECERGLLVGPDNGLLVPASRRLGMISCYEITNQDLMPNRISSTFHGRDIFAPVGAHLVSGLAPSAVGPVLEAPVDLEVEEYGLTGTGVEGRIGRVDRFGNVITNIPRAAVEELLSPGTKTTVRISGREHPASFVQTYSEGRNGALSLLFSSSDHLEIGIDRGSASDLLDASPGQKVVIEPGSDG